MINVELLAHTPEPERLIARAAKLCYSKSNISDITANMSDEDVEKFIGKLADMGHMSPFEHATFTFGIEGISRACYDKKTEILTNKGWKFFKDIDEKEVVATFNKDTEKVEFNKINEIIKYNYEGVMDRYKNDSFDLLVTPNHKMLVKKYDVRKEAEWGLVPSEELNLNRYRMTKAFNYNNKVKENITIKGYSYKRKVKNEKYITKHTGDLTFNRKIFYQFLAWYISDGSVYYSSKENKYVINISQTQCEENIKNKTVERIMHLIKKMGLNCCYDGRTVKFNSLTLGSYLKKLGHAKDKYIPLDLFKDFNKDLAKAFIDEYLKADGTIDKKGCAKIFTASKKLSDQIQTLVFISGDTAKINIDDRRGQAHICGNNIIRNSVCYVINISKIKNRNPILKTKEHKSKVAYNDTVYCVNVKNNTVFVRRNGVAMWCGNCSHQLVRHRIASYSQQSQRYVDMDNVNFVRPEMYKNEECNDSFEEAGGLANMLYRSFKANTYFYLLQKEVGEIEELIIPEERDITFNEILELETKMKEKYPKESKKIEKIVLENARAFLPNATETKIIVTMNARSLMNFFKLRCCSRAQDEIRELANIMLEKCKEVAPMLFKNAGPECLRTKCPEGAMTCGKPWKKEEE